VARWQPPDCAAFWHYAAASCAASSASHSRYARLPHTPALRHTPLQPSVTPGQPMVPPVPPADIVFATWHYAAGCRWHFRQQRWLHCRCRRYAAIDISWDSCQYADCHYIRHWIRRLAIDSRASAAWYVFRLITLSIAIHFRHWDWIRLRRLHCHISHLHTLY